MEATLGAARSGTAGNSSGNGNSSSNNSSGTLVAPRRGNVTAFSAPTSSAMPNPWGARQPSTRPATSNGSTLPGLPSMGLPPMGGLGPEQISAMLETPAVADLMSSMFNNPAFVEQMAAANPQIAPVLRDPAMRGMLANPAAIRASMQLQRAFAGRPGSLPAVPPAPASAVQTLDFSSILSGSGASSGPQTTPDAGAAADSSVSAAPHSSASRQSEEPNVRFASQVGVGHLHLTCRV